MDPTRLPAFTIPPHMPTMVPPIPMMPMMPAIPTPKMTADGAVPRAGQNVVFCYNPLMMPPPMRMLMPVMTPPVMMPMMPMTHALPTSQPQQTSTVVKEEEKPVSLETPLDLSTKCRTDTVRVKSEHLSDDFNKTDNNISISQTPKLESSEFIKTEGGLTSSQPCYKKNILKRYQGNSNQNISTTLLLLHLFMFLLFFGCHSLSTIG